MGRRRYHGADLEGAKRKLSEVGAQLENLLQKRIITSHGFSVAHAIANHRPPRIVEFEAWKPDHIHVGRNERLTAKFPKATVNVTTTSKTDAEIPPFGMVLMDARDPENGAVHRLDKSTLWPEIEPVFTKFVEWRMQARFARLVFEYILRRPDIPGPAKLYRIWPGIIEHLEKNAVSSYGNIGGTHRSRVHPSWSAVFTSIDNWVAESVSIGNTVNTELFIGVELESYTVKVPEELEKTPLLLW